ncbi:MAG TPA: Ig-like domain-containing protein [Kofleriaceae bacterium]
MRWLLSLVLALAACGSGVPPLVTAEPGVIFTYPADQQLDIPTGARIVVTFSEPVEAGALGPCSATTGPFCVVGPAGPVDAMPQITGDGRSVELAGSLEPGTTYGVYVRQDLAPRATNLPTAGPLFEFTTRAERPRAAAPALVAVNGSPVATPDSYRPVLESSTIRLVFSEPLDPRTVTLAPGSLELVDQATGTAVPALVVAQGIHASIDPLADLVPGTRYEVRAGAAIRDLGGRALTASSASFVPLGSGATTPILQTARTRQDGDPGPARSRSGADRNVISIDKPLIGRENVSVLPGTMQIELGDPKALEERGNAIAFTIRRGQRLSLSGLDIKLGGELPAGISTGDIQIELLTDAGGLLYRNPYHPTDQAPENAGAPLYVDLAMDLAVYSTDPAGNAVISQTILGVQTTGTAIATDGVLAIENVAAMEMSLLGMTDAPANMVLELFTDVGATIAGDSEPPILIVTSPAEGTSLHGVGDGIELGFSEPVDLARLRAGGLRLETAAGQAIATTLESHGATVVVRPVQRLPYATDLELVLGDVADVAGNPLAATTPLGFSTPRLAATSVPLTITTLRPGAPCALSNGHCAGGGDQDETYKPFELAANEPIDAVFSQPVTPGSITLGASCGTGSVRVEELDSSGTCTAVVAGTLIRRDRGLSFVPDVPWVVGKHYRLALVTGGNGSCDGNELCGIGNNAGSFDPLSGTEDGDAGGPALVVDFVGGAATTSVLSNLDVNPATDINGSGFIGATETRYDENRAALRITGTSGAVSSASFDMADCLPATPTVEGCTYLAGSLPVQLGELEHDCALPNGGTAPSCIPLGLSPQMLLGTSLSLDATVGITINNDTGTTLMRIREPSTGPLKGFIVDDNGKPKIIASLALYMDAPDLSIPLTSHDLHSKELLVQLEGPVTFLPDGQIRIQLSNVTDIPISIHIDAPLGLSGNIDMVLPRGEMRLQLLSRLLRGVEP